MADFPKFYTHVNPKLPNRVAHTPADAVNLEARGYKVSETKAAEHVAEQVAGQSNTGGGEQSADARNAAKRAESQNPNRS